MFRTILVSTLLLASCGMAWSGELNTAIVNSDRYLSVQVGGLQQNYRETQNGIVLDKEQGILPNIGVEYSLLGLRYPLRFMLGANYSSGGTHYKGALIGGPSYDTVTNNRILDAYVGLGYAFGNGTFALIPGLEYGEQSWVRNINHDTPAGYQERYGNQYMALTLEGQFALSQATVLSLGGAYGSTLNPTMTNNLVPGTFYLGNKPWARASLKLDFAAYNDMHVGLVARYTRFKYGASPNSIGGLIEPDSETQQSDFDFTLSYNF